MKNKRIEHAHQEVEIYREYYQSSVNPVRFLKSVLGVILFGSSTVAHSYLPTKRRFIK